jgi:hypothetical protein
MQTKPGTERRNNRCYETPQLAKPQFSSPHFPLLIVNKCLLTKPCFSRYSTKFAAT